MVSGHDHQLLAESRLVAVPIRPFEPAAAEWLSPWAVS